MTQPLPSPQEQQEAAVSVFAQYEPGLYTAYLEMMNEWLAAVQATVLSAGVTALKLMPDPMTVFSKTPAWTALTEEYTEEVAKKVLAEPYKRLGIDSFESRPFVQNWIATSANRLQNVPNEVFGLVQQIINAGTQNGASIPDVQEQIEKLFADTGQVSWKGRARTVARTEVVGAYNGGLHDAFSMIVEASPDEWQKRWLATEDSRTRLDHREADGQTVPFSQPFIVGGFEMMHPHAPGAPAKEVVNCRCVELLEPLGESTNMENRGYKGTPTLKASGFYEDDEPIAEVQAAFDNATERGETAKIENDGTLTLMQHVCMDGSFCMQTHKPGLCKGQKRGQSEPGTQDATKTNPVQTAQTAVNGLNTAIAQAQAAIAQNPTNPKLQQAAKRAIAGYQKALAPHQKTLKDAAAQNAKATKQGQTDAKQQDAIDARAKAKAARAHQSLEKKAAAIKAKRAEAAKVAKMTPKQRTAYHKAKAAQAKAKRIAAENKTLKEAAKK